MYKDYLEDLETVSDVVSMIVNKSGNPCGVKPLDCRTQCAYWDKEYEECLYLQLKRTGKILRDNAKEFKNK